MTVRPATAADIPGMIELLHGKMNPRISPERWMRLFKCKWMPDPPDYGRVVEIDGQILGCVAAVYADRTVNGRRERIVNPAAWYLDKSQRRRGGGLGATYGVRLLSDLVRNPDWHYHINTSSSLTPNLLYRMGFVELDTSKYVWQAKASTDIHVALEASGAAVNDLLTPHERQLIDDHSGLHVHPHVFSYPGGRAMVIVGDTIKTGGVRWLDVLYVSDIKFLARWGQQVANLLLIEGRTMFAADTRFCSHAPEGAERQLLKVPRFAKTSGLPPVAFDHLYTEVVLMNLKLS